jgi:hypothetical protein
MFHKACVNQVLFEGKLRKLSVPKELGVSEVFSRADNTCTDCADDVT